jgi:hypothetical protein
MTRSKTFRWMSKVVKNPTRKKDTKPFDRGSFSERYHLWSQEAEKRNKGAIGVYFGAVNDHYCIANSTYWGPSGDEYHSGKDKVAVSPKPDHPALCEKPQKFQVMVQLNSALIRGSQYVRAKGVQS